MDVKREGSRTSDFLDKISHRKVSSAWLTFGILTGGISDGPWWLSNWPSSFILNHLWKVFLDWTIPKKYIDSFDIHNRWTIEGLGCKQWVVCKGSTSIRGEIIGKVNLAITWLKRSENNVKDKILCHTAIILYNSSQTWCHWEFLRASSEPRWTQRPSCWTVAHPPPLCSRGRPDLVQRRGTASHKRPSWSSILASNPLSECSNTRSLRGRCSDDRSLCDTWLWAAREGSWPRSRRQTWTDLPCTSPRLVTKLNEKD